MSHATEWQKSMERKNFPSFPRTCFAFFFAAEEKKVYFCITKYETKRDGEKFDEKPKVLLKWILMLTIVVFVRRRIRARMENIEMNENCLQMRLFELIPKR